MDILRDIHLQHLDIYIGIWDIYMPSIIPQPLATDPSHGRAKIAAIYVKVLVIDDDNLSSIPAGGANMGLRRCPACAGPRCPAGAGPLGRRQRLPSGLAPTRLLSCGDGRPGADTTSSWSHDGGRTGKKINVSGIPARVQKSVFKIPQNRTREWGHWSPSSIL